MAILGAPKKSYLISWSSWGENTLHELGKKGYNFGIKIGMTLQDENGSLDRCIHSSTSCINPYEIIRKYRCHSCRESMMCACEEEFARRFLPHDLSFGTELDTQRRVLVTQGFQKGICNTCRGLPEAAHPKAPRHGSTSKIRRYYWREIFFETTRRFAEWAENRGYKDWLVAQNTCRDVYDSFEQKVIEEIKKLHRYSPKYVYQEQSQDEILTKYQVEVVRLGGLYTKDTGSGATIFDRGELCSPEEFAMRHFERLGYSVLFTESVPFHALFGVFMWLLIQDASDPKVRMSGIGNREAFEQGDKAELIWTLLPEDFGTPGYAIRRENAIGDHFVMLAGQKGELLWIFDYWVEHSANLRQYLWAHRPQDITKARKIVSILPADTVLRILRYLVGDYWRRYVGWPDILVYNQREFFFAEVKSSKDKLSEDQKNWIRGNSVELHLPFKLVKIHKQGVVGE